MEHVGVCDSINGSVDGDAKEEDTGEVAKPRCHSRYHFATGQGLDEKDKWHDRENIVVRRKWSEPVNSQIVYPDDENGEIDRENPQHENEDRVDVVVKVVVGVRTGFPSESKSACTSGYLHETCNQVGELVRYDSRNEEQEYCGRQDTSPRC